MRHPTAPAAFRNGTAVNWLRENAIIPCVVVFAAVSALIEPSFLSMSNAQNMLIQIALLGLVVIGQSFVIITRGLDLSVASTMGSAAIAITTFPRDFASPWTILPAALLIGLLVGATNGYLIAKRNVSPFLATLATTIIFQGIRFYWTQGAATGEVMPFFRLLGTGYTFGVSNCFVVLVLVAAIFGVVLQRSRYGRQLYLVGSSPLAASLVGIKVGRVVAGAYMISGVLAALSGLLLAGYVGTVDNYLGRGYELQSIVAAVIGGVALTGGSGKLLNALFGAAMLVIISNAILLFGIPIQAQIILNGVIVLAVAAIYSMRSGEGSRA